MPTANSLRRHLYAVFLFLLVMLIAGYFASMDPDWHHDGILFKPATDVASGLSLFRETFSQYGALTTYLQAIALALFGKELIVIRYQAVLFLSFTGVLLFYTCRRIVPDSVAAFSVILWLAMAPYLTRTFLPWSSIYALFFMVCGVWLLLRGDGLNGRPRAEYWYCFWGGFAFTACFWARQPTGIVFASIFIFFIMSFLNKEYSFAHNAYKSLSYLTGFIICNTFVFAWLLADGSLQDWWKQSIVGAHTFASETSGSIDIRTILAHLFPKSRSVSGANPIPIWSILPIINLITFLFLIIRLAIKRKQSRVERTLLILTLLGLGSWHQYYPRTSVGQVYWGASPMIGITIAVTYISLRSLRLNHIASLSIVLILLIFAFGKDLALRFSYVASTIPIAAAEFPTLKGMWLTNRFPEKNNYERAPEGYFHELDLLGEVLSNLKMIDPTISLLTFTGDAYLPTVLKNQNGHKITVWWRWAIRMYPDHKDKIRTFVRENRPLIEIKVKPWGWDRYDWANPNSPIRDEYGFGDYELLVETDYSDSGTAQILGPPELLTLYRNRFGTESIKHQ